MEDWTRAVADLLRRVLLFLLTALEEVDDEKKGSPTGSAGNLNARSLMRINLRLCSMAKKMTP